MFLPPDSCVLAWRALLQLCPLQVLPIFQDWNQFPFPCPLPQVPVTYAFSQLSAFTWWLFSVTSFHHSWVCSLSVWVLFLPTYLFPRAVALTFYSRNHEGSCPWPQLCSWNKLTVWMVLPRQPPAQTADEGLGEMWDQEVVAEFQKRKCSGIGWLLTVDVWLL